jgi:hypothetical protein
VAVEEDPLPFLWDVRLGELEFGRLLAEGADDDRLWAIRRLLEYGEWHEIWCCLTLDDVDRALPRLRFRTPELRSFWQEAVARWRARGVSGLSPGQHDFLRMFFAQPFAGDFYLTGGTAQELRNHVLDRLRPPR